MSQIENAAFFLARLTVGLLFVNAAWACGKNAAARTWTTSETALVFPAHSLFFAMAGIAIMGMGGLSLVAGAFARPGAVMLAVFLIPGAMIHFVQRRRAAALQEAVVESVPESSRSVLSQSPLGELAISASLGHYSSALKNLALVGPLVLIAGVGGGEWILIDLNRDFQLVGALAR